MTLQALEQNVKIAADAYELECLFAGYNENAEEVVAAKSTLIKAQETLARAAGAARAEREHAESCRIAAAMKAAPTEAEALDILRRANNWEQDQRANAAAHRSEAHIVDELELESIEYYADIPDEDGRRRWERTA